MLELLFPGRIIRAPCSSMSKIDDQKASYISLLTCDNCCAWITCWEGFRRKFVKKALNKADETTVPLNDPFCSGAHLGYLVHGKGDLSRYSPTCILPGGHVIQPPHERKPNVFNTVYWRRCDGTYRNSLDEKLVNPNGSDRLHTLQKVRLGDVLVPWPQWECPEQQRAAYERDLATYEKFKDCFVTRFI